MTSLKNTEKGLIFKIIKYKYWIAIKSFFEKWFSSEPEERHSFSEIVQEIMQDNFKELFEVDQNEVNNYLDLFDKDLIDPDRYSDLDINKSY